MKTVMEVFEEIAPEINLAENPLVDNLPVDGVKNYLTRNQPKFKFCVLVVDALTVKDAYESQRQQKYEELLATAADEVGKIVGYTKKYNKCNLIVLFCGAV